MKRTTFLYVLLMASAFSFARSESSVPNSSVPTPVERNQSMKESPNLNEKERLDWNRMREERKMAREQILSRLRESSNMERQTIRENLSKNRNERPRMEGDSPKNQPRGQDPFGLGPDSRNKNPERGQPDPYDKRDPMRK